MGDECDVVKHNDVKEALSFLWRGDMMFEEHTSENEDLYRYYVRKHNARSKDYHESTLRDEKNAVSR